MDKVNKLFQTQGRVFSRRNLLETTHRSALLGKSVLRSVQTASRRGTDDSTLVQVQLGD